jgi:transcriptional regulator
VQASGPLKVIDDRAWLAAQVSRLTRSQEEARAEPWAVTDAPPSFIESQLKGIIGIEIPIARLEGKWKVSQNRPEADRRGVVEGLRAKGSGAEQAMAELVLERGGPPRS